MIKFGQAYSSYVNRAFDNSNQKTTKTDNDAVDTEPGTPTKEGLNIDKGDEYRQWTNPEDGGETYAEAIVREGDTSTLGKAVAYFAAFESLYGVQPNSEENTDDSNNDTRIVWSLTGLGAYGIIDTDIINQYFDNRGIQNGLKGQAYEGYSLKNDIEINGVKITTVDELLQALGKDEKQ